MKPNFSGFMSLWHIVDYIKYTIPLIASFMVGWVVYISTINLITPPHSFIDFILYMAVIIFGIKFAAFLLYQTFHKVTSAYRAFLAGVDETLTFKEAMVLEGDYYRLRYTAYWRHKIDIPKRIYDQHPDGLNRIDAELRYINKQIKS